MQCECHTRACFFTVSRKAPPQKAEAAIASVLQAPLHKAEVNRYCIEVRALLKRDTRTHRRPSCLPGASKRCSTMLWVCAETSAVASSPQWNCDVWKHVRICIFSYTRIYIYISIKRHIYRYLVHAASWVSHKTSDVARCTRKHQQKGFMQWLRNKGGLCCPGETVTDQDT